MLTKKFVDLIEKADGGILDLNQAADLLQVRGRGSRLGASVCILRL
jgi:hypothetical protein